MTDNGKIAIWAGWTKFVPDTDCPVLKHWMNWTAPDGTKYDTPPNYCKSDTAAVKLLPLLVERGYGVTLNGTLAADYVSFDCHIRHKPKQVISVVEMTVAGAISAAVLQLIADKP